MKERLLGFSTGAFYKFAPYPKDAVKIIEQLKCNAIEINWHSRKDFPPRNWKVLKAAKFEKVSLHLPVDCYYTEGYPTTAPVLNRAYKFYLSVSNFSHVVIHPNLVSDWSDFYLEFDHNWAMPLAIENMDNRKDSFITSQSWEELFDQFPLLKFVFDVNHYLENGNSIESIPQIISSFAENLVGIHLSGLGFHKPLFKTADPMVVRALRGLDPNIPIILESICQDRDEAERELSFVKKHLGNGRRQRFR